MERHFEIDIELAADTYWNQIYDPLNYSLTVGDGQDGEDDCEEL